MSNVFVEFLVNQGLYDKIEITEDNISDLCDLIDGKERISVYCKIVGRCEFMEWNLWLLL